VARLRHRGGRRHAAGERRRLGPSASSGDEALPARRPRRRPVLGRLQLGGEVEQRLVGAPPPHDLDADRQPAGAGPTPAGTGIGTASAGCPVRLNGAASVPSSRGPGRPPSGHAGWNVAGVTSRSWASHQAVSGTSTSSIARCAASTSARVRPAARSAASKTAASSSPGRTGRPSRSDTQARTDGRVASLTTANGGTPGMRPAVGTSVTSPHRAAGHRSEPVASEPCAIGTAPQATAAADPPLDPPAERDRSHGLRVGANPGGSVVTPLASGGHAALPTIENPAASNRAASSVVARDRCPASRSAATPTWWGVPASSCPASLRSIGIPGGARSASGATRNPRPGSSPSQAATAASRSSAPLTSPRASSRACSDALVQRSSPTRPVSRTGGAPLSSAPARRRCGWGRRGPGRRRRT
jgi:hypothetical protein